MKKEQVQRKPKKHINSVVVSYRITPHMAAWIKKENISPRLAFIQVCKDFGYKPED